MGILGAAEPPDVAAHEGVFASHYDQGRLFGVLARGELWSRLADLSISAFPAVAQDSGIPFYQPAGRLHMPTTYLRGGGYVERVEAAHDLDVWHVSAAEAALALPYLQFPGAAAGYWERGRAGYLNPRLLVQAQLALAERQGAALIREQATAVTPEGDHLRVTTTAGHNYTASKVLLATGAFTNCFDLLPEKLPLLTKTETILLAEVPESEVERLGEHAFGGLRHRLGRAGGHLHDAAAALSGRPFLPQDGRQFGRGPVSGNLRRDRRLVQDGRQRRHAGAAAPRLPRPAARCARAVVADRALHYHLHHAPQPVY